MTPTQALQPTAPNTLGDAPAIDDLSEADVLDMLLEWDYNVPLVAERLNTSQSRVKAIIARNQPVVAQHMRALSTLSMFETFSTSRDVMLQQMENMEPYDIAKVYEKASSTMETITRSNREGVVINNNNNVNMLLQALPGELRSKVEQLVQLSDAEFEALEAQALVDSDDSMSEAA